MQNPVEFSKKSRRAILIFTTLVLVLVLLPRFYFSLKKDADFVLVQTDFEKKEFSKHRFKPYEKRNFSAKKSKFSAPPQKFDPNQYSISDWMKVGLSEKQAAVILKFNKRGFRSNEDLKRVFVINDELFALLKDSTFYPEKASSNFSTFEEKNDYTSSKSKKSKVEINSANVEDLLSIPGIGEFFAKNILKRREQLGGFLNEDQLLEVWKMDAEKIDAIRPFISINPSGIKKINLNTATAEELKNHPYIKNWNIANSIVKMRTQNGGKFNQVEDILKSVLIDKAFFEKVKPYLTVE